MLMDVALNKCIHAFLLIITLKEMQHTDFITVSRLCDHASAKPSVFKFMNIYSSYVIFKTSRPESRTCSSQSSCLIPMPYDKPIFEKEVVQSQFVVSHSGLLHKNEKGKNTNRCVNLILAFRIVVQIYLW